jgi:23S rRNA pseudouridine2457 synthase
MPRLILLNKPYGVLCQFTSPDGRPTLADYVDRPGVYPAGRLDADSEGLVVLTDDGALQARITSPRRALAKTYWVQVENEPTDEAIAELARGVELRDGTTRPAEVARLVPPPRCGRAIRRSACAARSRRRGSRSRSAKGATGRCGA